MSLLQNLIQQVEDLTKRYNDMSANSKRTDDLQELPEATEDALVRVTVQGESYKTPFKQNGETPTLDEVANEDSVSTIPLTAPAFVVPGKTEDDILVGPGSTIKASDFAKNNDFQSHIQNLNNPHVVQAKQIPYGRDLSTFFKNKLL